MRQTELGTERKIYLGTIGLISSAELVKGRTSIDTRKAKTRPWVPFDILPLLWFVVIDRPPYCAVSEAVISLYRSQDVWGD